LSCLSFTENLTEYSGTNKTLRTAPSHVTLPNQTADSNLIGIYSVRVGYIGYTGVSGDADHCLEGLVVRRKDAVLIIGKRTPDSRLHQVTPPRD